MKPQEDHEVVIDWAAAHAREAYRRGVRPARIIRELIDVFTQRLHYWNSILFVVTARRAFGLTIAECKGADDFWRGGRIDDDGIDGYLVPLIERNRSDWDR